MTVVIVRAVHGSTIESKIVHHPQCRTVYAGQFYANRGPMRVPHISHIAAFFAYFSRVRISHIFFRINRHYFNIFVFLFESMFSL